MAFFDRGDDRGSLLLCNICNVKCSERSITSHRAGCSEKPNFAHKFSEGQLVRCKYDCSHIFGASKLESHLEFCGGYQDTLVATYQEARMDMTKTINNVPRASVATTGENDDILAGRLESLNIG